MNQKTKLLVLVASLVVLIAGAAFLYNSLENFVDTNQLATQPTQAPTSPSEETDSRETEPQYSPARDFTMIDGNGKAYQLSAFFGKPMVLNFWASWCGPCKMEMPDFEEVYLERGDEIQFLMVNCTTSAMENFTQARNFIQDAGYTFPVFYDTTGEGSTLYGTSSIPMTFFINAQGQVVAYARGAIDSDVLAQGIAMITGE